MKTLIIGMDGQLGSELMNIFEDAIGTSRRGEGIHLDLRNGDHIENVILKTSPDVVINAAAYTDVDGAERSREEAYAVNAIAVGRMVRASSVVGSYFVQVSADYVFDGTKGNYREEDVANPINFYGFTKAIGEAYALSYDDSLVIRTSGVFGKKSNFPLYVARKIMQGDTVFCLDSYYSPISARKLALAMKQVVERRLYGILNIAGPRISRYEFAERIRDRLNIRTGRIALAESIDGMVARRPRDSSLDTSKARRYTSVNINTLDDDIDLMGDVLR